MMQWVASAAVVVALLVPGGAEAGPARPVQAAEIDSLTWGVFCAPEAMAQSPAPGTRSGWINVPDREIDFHWPSRQVVPAALGLAFGVKATGIPGWASVAGQARAYRPDRDTPDVWDTRISDAGPTISFFRFDRPDELVIGPWAIEVWDGKTRLYRAEFEVVPAAALPEIVQACGAIS